ncbi:MAG TPA: citrate/2-methylcitrate synthase [Phycisphaerales bacterium]|nr:citrate/2-methylcitrate synthase [Phycisphaerales bacterium]
MTTGTAATATTNGPTAASSFARGLEGIVAGQTSICSVEQGALIYRGYEIHDLADHATFDQVAFLLLEGRKPEERELAEFKREIAAQRPLPREVIEFLRSSGPMLRAGTAVPMDVLRTGVSILGNLDPDAQDSSPAANLRKSKRLLARIPTIIGHMQNVIDGRPMVALETGGDPSLDHAANLLYLMTGTRPAPDHARVLDVSLILYAEHDYNASTFTARVIAGTLSDLHGAVTGAIAALKGPLHGGANEAAMEMLKEIAEHTGGKADEAKITEFMRHAFATKRKLMGFGHRVYKNGDHRAPILNTLGRRLAEKQGPEAVRWFDIGDVVERIMLREKNIHPNVDFPCGMTYFVMGIPVPQYTPIFVASRITGWCAHVMEQHADNRLIRPLSQYVGPGARRW